MTVHLPIAFHPRLGDESFDHVLDGLLTRKREQSRRVIVPSAMSERDFAEFYSRMTAGGVGVGHQTLDDIDRKDWRSFENWVAGRFQSAVWQVNDTPASGDGGADVICRHPKGKRPVLIQVKHRQMGQGTVPEAAVQEVRAAPARYRQHAWIKNPILLVATNGTFDLPARTAAAQGQVRLIERSEIVALDAVAHELLARE